MIPLSCLNCCHNPLQLGPIGTAFGFCIRHRLVLNQAQSTTCGRLLRKDLLAASADSERVHHATVYPRDRVVLVASPDLAASKRGFVEKPNGQLRGDPTIEEVQDYGRLDSSIATMAALHRIAGARAEVAMLSLSRGYFRNCVARGGSWTAGVHLLFWTLRRLDRDPELDATDIRGPITFSLGHTIAVARWVLVAFRLAFVGDVGAVAREQGDKVGYLATLPARAVKGVPGLKPDGLLGWLSERRPRWSAPLSARRYATLREQLHQDPDNEMLPAHEHP